ncbi:MAG TPA: hypothetical protein VIN35_06780 [Hydrogenophaga sp.]
MGRRQNLTLKPLDPQAPLGSAELAAVASKLGKLPTKEEYLAATGVITANAGQICTYMNFDQIEEYVDAAKSVA